MTESIEGSEPELLFDLVLPSGRKFWAVGEVTILTALAVYPHTQEETEEEERLDEQRLDASACSNKTILREVSRLNAARDHYRALAAMMENGQVETRNPSSYAPNVGGGVLIGDEHRKKQLITLKQFARFAATLGIRVTQQKLTSETPEARQKRLQQRVNDEKSIGTRAFLKVVAQEEKITPSRLKQILAKQKNKIHLGQKWAGLAHAPSQSTSKAKK